MNDKVTRALGGLNSTTERPSLPARRLYVRRYYYSMARVRGPGQHRAWSEGPRGRRGGDRREDVPSVRRAKLATPIDL